MAKRNTSKSKKSKSKSKSQETPKDYLCGFCRPPKASQFKKGQSGNPKGRPKHPVTVDECLNRVLSKTMVVHEGDKTKKITRMEAMVTHYIKEIFSDNSLLKFFMKNNASNINLTELLYPKKDDYEQPSPRMLEAMAAVRTLLRQELAAKFEESQEKTSFDDYLA